MINEGQYHERQCIICCIHKTTLRLDIDMKMNVSDSVVMCVACMSLNYEFEY